MVVSLGPASSTPQDQAMSRVAAPPGRHRLPGLPRLTGRACGSAAIGVPNRAPDPVRAACQDVVYQRIGIYLAEPHSRPVSVAG
jgi:hypothetical protein